MHRLRVTHRLRRFTANVVLALLLTQPAWAWNYVTHRVIAAMAYDRLRPAARSRVDELIRLHPDYERLFLRDAPKDATLDDPGRARAAFIAAAMWADEIRNDHRFYEDTASEVPRTPRWQVFRM